ncbi:hypothetical protein [Bradyrhizobium sp. CER78]|uniref:hypothetical protein n=1 Tax=Bradyrhizobium sp. CER78 TaxID=3039162 RepID=UPI00244A28A4|nr:hypothetical protein [Bradyrhizobium sp. CER78]MDH2381396.1 hypothetical protein [Bradyrhizobium sp. CER78]
MWTSHIRLCSGSGFVSWIGLALVVQSITSSLLNSHLSDFHQGWMYVIGVAGGMALRVRQPEKIPAAGAAARPR